MMRHRVRVFPAAVAGLLFVTALTGCEGHKQLDRATRVSDAGAQTFDGLAGYYGKLARESQNFPALYVTRVGPPEPGSPAARAMADHRRSAASYRMRLGLCLAIKGLYASMHRISTSTPDAAQAAAADLHAAALKCKGFPAQVSVLSTPVPAAVVSQALKAIISDTEDLQKIRDIKRGNGDLRDILDKFQIIYQHEQFKYAQDRGSYAKEHLIFTQWAIAYHLVSAAPTVQSLLDMDQLKATELASDASDRLANQVALDRSGPTPAEAAAEAQSFADSIEVQIEAQHALAGEMRKNPAL